MGREQVTSQPPWRQRRSMPSSGSSCPPRATADGSETTSQPTQPTSSPGQSDQPALARLTRPTVTLASHTTPTPRTSPASSSDTVRHRVTLFLHRSPLHSPTPSLAEHHLTPIHEPPRPSPRPSPSTLSLSLHLTNPPQPVLSRKHEALLFLYTIASSSRAHSTPAPPFLATLYPPTTRPPSAAPSPVDPRPSRQKSKAVILREYRARTGTPSPLVRLLHSLTQPAQARLPEHLLLRDTLYLLQGISGKYIQLAFSDQDDINKLVFLDDTVHHLSISSFPSLTHLQRYIIPSPVRSLIHRLAEVGHLYSRVDAFVKDSQRRSAVGMIEQSLCHHLQAQLTEYYRLVATLESQMSIPNTDTDTDTADRESALTLKRLDVWVNDWRLRMRMMSVCVEGARGTHFQFSPVYPL